MFGVYVIGSLSPEQIPQAFPVISASNPDITLEDWSNYAALFVVQPLAQEPSDIVTVQCPNGYIHGLACCRARHDLHLGRMLVVENFVSLDLSGGKRAGGALLQATEDKARDWNCVCVCLLLPSEVARQAADGRETPVVQLFQTEGYRQEHLRLAKSLTVSVEPRRKGCGFEGDLSPRLRSAREDVRSSETQPGAWRAAPKGRPWPDG